MWTHVATMLGGLVALVVGAEGFIRGAAALARHFGVPPIVVGLTVVAYGTSMPELVVSAVAAFEGRSAIALGNVVGSNIANIGLILGLTAVISPPLVDGTLLKGELPWMASAALAIPLLLLDGAISRGEAVLLLAAAVLFTVRTVRSVRDEPGADDRDDASAVDERAASAERSALLKAVAFTVVGLGALLLGGRFFVNGASAVAVAFGISERIIGLTVVAVGTSLPELAASAVAAWRGFSSLAVGNVVGSNIFNVLFVLGGAGAIAPISGDVQAQRFDLLLLVGFTALAVWVMRGARRITRVEGAVMLAAYVASIVWLARGGG
ncbi:MAG: calcium/sodium antiporter [Gemmatimonadaceae bacterium]|jgi:cation:H+ antiporter|nr:calcium/sodium antiporter [Gemmatimonadaceae bacterium]